MAVICYGIGVFSYATARVIIVIDGGGIGLSGLCSVLDILLFVDICVTKILANVFNACDVAVPNSRKGVAGVGFCSAAVRSEAARMAASVEDNCGILNV